MALSWKHVGSENEKPHLTGKFASVDSGLLAHSLSGETMLWSTGFSGCIGLVLCGTKPGGVLAHLNQAIQSSGKDLNLAVQRASEFAKEKINSSVTDVLIYYGDAESNRGQMSDLNKNKIKDLVGCERVIDLRRTGKDAPYGIDFVYDPKKQIVYTSSIESSTALEDVGLGEEDELSPKPGRTNFAYKDQAEKNKLTPGLGHKGWFEVP